MDLLMTRPRKEQVCLDDTPYYHITSRCVRRAFLCGYDQLTDTSFEHRRQWVEDRIRLLSSLFAIDVCAYAVMSNHYHLVIKLDPDQATSWTADAVAQRWLCLFKGTRLIQKYRAGETLSVIEQQTANDTLAIYKQRLTQLDWFMKCLNEPIARQANQEDHCTGHFWEGRYKSQALREDAAIFTCMAYVDLNPIRAGMADRPEHSEHTSIKERLTQRFKLKTAVEEQLRRGSLQAFDVPLKPLTGFSDHDSQRTGAAIPIGFADYLELLDYTGRVVRDDKRGVIPSHLKTVFDRIQISPESWLANTTQFEALFRRQPRRKRSNE